VLSGNLEHNHEVSDQEIERKVLRCSVKRKANDDISSRPAKVIRTELCEIKEDNLQPADLFC